MINPYGEDDDDYEMNVFIDQYMKVSLWGTGIRGLMRGMVTLPKVPLPGAISGQRQIWKIPR